MEWYRDGARAVETEREGEGEGGVGGRGGGGSVGQGTVKLCVAGNIFPPALLAHSGIKHPPSYNFFLYIKQWQKINWHSPEKIKVAEKISRFLAYAYICTLTSSDGKHVFFVRFFYYHQLTIAKFYPPPDVIKCPLGQIRLSWQVQDDKEAAERDWSSHCTVLYTGREIL